jgi:hypothetical protein
LALSYSRVASLAIVLVQTCVIDGASKVGMSTGVVRAPRATVDRVITDVYATVEDGTREDRFFDE